ncbi:MAG: hypothetical protein ACRD09_00930 [Vicinamibacterales bacterium]
MKSSLAGLFDDLRRGRFTELAGSRAAIDLAIPEALINRALADALAGSEGRLRGVTVVVHPDDRFHLDLQLSPSVLPSIAVEAVLDRQPALPESPEFVFRWRTLLPGLAALAGSAASFFKALPPGVRMEGDRVFVDIRPILDRAGAADLPPLLSELRLSTRKHVVDLHLLARVQS